MLRIDGEGVLVVLGLVCLLRWDGDGDEGLFMKSVWLVRSVVMFVVIGIVVVNCNLVMVSVLVMLRSVSGMSLRM